MTQRREFLQMSVTASLGTVLPFPLFAHAGRDLSASTLLPYRILHDVQLPDSLGHARNLAKQLSTETGYNAGSDLLQAIDGDITPFWFHDLYYIWLQQPQPLAGVTAQSSLFCLEQLAREKQLKVVWQQNHGIPDSTQADSLVSWVIADPKLV